MIKSRRITSNFGLQNPKVPQMRRQPTLVKQNIKFEIMNQASKYHILGQNDRLLSHDHKLRKKTYKQYNQNMKSLKLHHVKENSDEPIDEVITIEHDEPVDEQIIDLEIQEQNELKFKLNPKQIHDKTQEKIQRKIQQLLQFQIMQQNYLSSFQNKKEQQYTDKMQQDQHKNQILDELVKNRKILSQKTQEQQTISRQKAKIAESQPPLIKQQPSKALKTKTHVISPVQLNEPIINDLIDEMKDPVQTIPIRKKIHVCTSNQQVNSSGETLDHCAPNPQEQEPIPIKKVKLLEVDLPRPEVIVQQQLIETDCTQIMNSMLLETWTSGTDIKNINQVLRETIVSGKSYQEMSSQIDAKFYEGHLFVDDETNLQIDELRLSNPVSKNDQVNHDGMEVIELVNNLNQKIKINVSSKPQSYNWKRIYEIAGVKADDSQVPSIHQFSELLRNPFDSAARDTNFKTGQFRTKYQSGYAPVAMQQREEESQQKKTHFIRQKQSQANLSLKRTCGVSYVKPSESKQVNVNHIFKKLPPLMYQCSSGSEKIEGFDVIYEELFQQLLNGKYPIICTWHIGEEEETIRDYLLFSDKRLEISKHRIYLFKELKDLWMICIDQSTICIHLKYDHQTLITGFDSQSNTNMEQQLADYVVNSDLIICVSFKKGLSGRKSFLKSVGLFHLYEKQAIACDGNDNTCVDAQQQTRSENPLMDTPKKIHKSGPSQALVDLLKKEEGHVNLYTSSIRMELVVDQNKWDSSPKMTKSLLTGFIQYTDLKIQSTYLVKMMNKRLKAYAQGVSYLTKKMLKSLRTVELQCQGRMQSCKYNWSTEFKKETMEACVQMKTRYLHMEPLKNALESVSQPLHLEALRPNHGKGSSGKETSYLEHPLYCISTRDSFAYDLIEKIQFVMMNGRRVKKTEYFFEPSNCPNNYAPTFLSLFPDYKVGLVSYDDYFTHEEMTEIESNIFETEVKAFNNVYMPQTAQIQIGSTVGHTASVRRTKFFFGYRYMWTRCQLAEPNSMVAAGVRRDVSETPLWMRNLVVNKLEDCGIIPKNFVNSIACNVYHDGKEGLAQHFDDAVRFRQPIFTLRAFSDCRLCFGSQYYGFCNGAFAVPLARGCILVMEEESYAANGIKHCVRPCDMTGKSAAVIMRQMHHQVTSEADKFDEIVDFPCQFSTLSMDENAVPYGEQKRLEGEVLLAHK